MSQTVTCENCGRPLAETYEGQPCPICGSTARSLTPPGHVSVSHFGRASELATVARMPLAEVSAELTPEADAVRARYLATLEWSALDNGFFLLHVLNERGEVVEGGAGNDPEKALLEVYERLLPPT